MTEKNKDVDISIALNTLLDSQQYIRKDVGKVKDHLVTLNHRTEKLELQNMKEAVRAETNKEWQTKENARLEESTKFSRFWITTILALMTLISTGVAVIVTQVL